MLTIGIDAHKCHCVAAGIDGNGRLLGTPTVWRLYGMARGRLEELVPADEIEFGSGVFLLRKETAAAAQKETASTSGSRSWTDLRAREWRRTS